MNQTAKRNASDKTCRICQNIHGEWGMHFYATPTVTGYRYVAGKGREQLMAYAKKKGFTMFFDGANGGKLVAL